MKNKWLIPILSIILLATTCSKSSTSNVSILHAGSLSIPFKQISEAFMIEHPRVRIQLEAYGSLTCARQIIDLHRRIDVIALADSSIIRDFLIPKYASFCVDFATNEMTIMFTENSKYKGEINSQNWFDILLRSDVQVGHSNPDTDPCGYRTLITWQLSEIFYEIPGLYKNLREKISKKNIRPKVVDLIALLETGDLDYVFTYRSIAHQHNMKSVSLPEAVNLRSTRFSDFYKIASVEITGKTPGEKIEKRGAPMVYGITIPNNADNPEWGARFTAFLLGEIGKQIMKNNGQSELTPPTVDHHKNMPDILRKFFQPNGNEI